MAKRFIDFFLKRRFQISTIFLLIVSFLIFSGTSHPAIYYMQIWFSDILAPLKEPIVILKELTETRKTNEMLSRHLIQLSQEAARFTSLSEENQRLREMLDLKRTSSYDLLPALVLSEGIHKSVNSLLLNKGKKDSVDVNDPVLNVQGLVGRIFFVGESSSLAQLLVDPNLRVSVKIQPSGAKGILQWYGKNRFLIADISSTLEVKPGNLVVTSGYSDIYPNDLPVGIVSELTPSPDGFTNLVFGDFLVNFNQIHEVFILLQ
ncbi:MAG: rod shape-determining protein MreC [Candidatus Marinimicrobia bacterium]|nr:rod shape-determining protein MreC [Candidatus Neomarinimicrobiota bacterium]MDD5582482.1 rod shape-determining protein MreC [Candidatus Neomarinimicrobiota bacterium]